jgi:hypothetical protein
MALFTNSTLKKAVALVGFLASSVDAVDRVNLGTAGEFAILSKAGATTTGVTSVTGDIGASPIAASALTGFALTKDSSNTFSTSAIVTGKVWAADYMAPTPSKMTTAISDMQTAFTDAAGRSTPDHLNLGAGSVSDLTLEPGLYKWGTDVGFTSSLTFNGTSEDVWILQIAGDLTVASGARIHLTGEATAENIFWQISGKTTFESTAHVEGVFLCATAIVFKTGSSMNGAALSQTAVNLDAATIVKEDNLYRV